jgi:response regulator RpfG family c-di-GMP phosphodiesterase
MEYTQRSIFVVDDEEAIRKVLNTHLTKEGYNVIQCSGGREVFNLLENNSFELVISDIRMPEVDGVKILEFIKERFDTVPVIMLTGLTDITIAVDVMKKGAFDYIIKPVKKEDLLYTIQRAFIHRDLLERNRELERENREYRMFLEKRVEERTEELNIKAEELQAAYGMLKAMNINFANALAETIEAKDRHTSGHCGRMRNLCVRLGKLLGLKPEEIEILEYASLLHDLGKVSVNELILNKGGPLNEEEFMSVKRHSEVGEKILKDIPLMKQVAIVIGAHHENFDGSGYPRGLKGSEIPIIARIIAVADTFDAMSSDRPYRKGLSLEFVIGELKRVSGTQLDPQIVEVFVENKESLLNNSSDG